MIKLTINGKEHTLDAPTRLVEYLEALDVRAKSIAVAHNGTVLRREEFEDIMLDEGDEVEIVRAVGGG